jgi:integrase/recombinase XerD
MYRDCPTLIEAYTSLVETKKEHLNAGVEPSTIKAYNARLNSIRDFLLHINKSELKINKVDDEFVRRYEIWLKTKERSCGQNYFMKNLQSLKSLMSYCVKKQHIQNNPLSFQKILFKKTFKTSLNKSELKMLRKKKFQIKRLQQVADLFLIQCYTGLSFIDLMLFDKGLHVRRGCIIIKRQKTDTISQIPIKKRAKKLFKKHNWKLPRISNQKYNCYLKEIGEITGIEKNLTTHVGRKTFANLYLNEGVSLEVVSAMLGHSNTKITQRSYVDIDEIRIKRETKGIKI